MLTYVRILTPYRSSTLIAVRNHRLEKTWLKPGESLASTWDMNKKGTQTGTKAFVHFLIDSFGNTVNTIVLAAADDDDEGEEGIGECTLVAPEDAVLWC